RVALGGGVRCGEERALHEVEVIQQADPGDAGEEVQPAEEKLNACVGEERHLVPPVGRNRASACKIAGRPPRASGGTYKCTLRMGSHRNGGLLLRASWQCSRTPVARGALPLVTRCS